MRTGKAGRPPQDPARQLARAHRILDAAGELVLRWGYDKTTIDDVATTAGVAKGTIYLHWKTREELFSALLRRERVILLTEVRRRAEDGTGMPGELITLLAGALVERPIMKASLLGDSSVLGKLTRLKRDSDSPTALETHLETYLGELMTYGALRADLTPREHAHILASILYGFMIVPQLLPAGYRLPDARLAELTGDAGGRALTPNAPDAPVTPENARAIARVTLDYVDNALEIAQRKLAASLGDPLGDPLGSKEK
ncbi:TetR/AcrR family transcriptional regulator [Streptosporangium sp. KLBMP 9127]|nr:TetR/AcrR family transcriptional regulator [Streptosporangium sp. KLBMP 9127]